ncbi:MAG TPA: T9SS type A sorting domain-containing protein, partial [Bacteroidia bacterium]|nr:T9SS type A sorting domain-containing protein [Bacteroidia bacterium]
LKQFDVNGKSGDAKIAQADVPVTGGLSVFPNPCKGNFELGISTKELVTAENTEITVCDMLGNHIFHASIVAGEDASAPTYINIPIDLGSDARGVYFYQVISGGKLIFNGKVVSQ